MIIYIVLLPHDCSIIEWMVFLSGVCVLCWRKTLKSDDSPVGVWTALSCWDKTRLITSVLSFVKSECLSPGKLLRKLVRKSEWKVTLSPLVWSSDRDQKTSILVIYGALAVLNVSWSTWSLIGSWRMKAVFMWFTEHNYCLVSERRILLQTVASSTFLHLQFSSLIYYTGQQLGAVYSGIRTP